MSMKLWIVSLTGVSAELSECVVFSKTSSGGVVVENGAISVSNCSFEGTASVNSSSSSVEHIFVCKSSEITIDGLNGEEITNTTSLWMVEDFCTPSITPVTPSSTYFIPTLTSVSVISDTDDITLGLSGTLLVPCKLSCIIQTPSGTEIPNTLSQDFLNEKSWQVTIASEDASNLNTLSVHLRYATRSSAESENEFISGTALDIAVTSSSSSSLSTSAIIIIATLSGTFLLLLIVGTIICVSLYRRYKKQQEKLTEFIRTSLINGGDEVTTTRILTTTTAYEETAWADEMDPCFEN